jgi:hypothetical protein
MRSALHEKRRRSLIETIDTCSVIKKVLEIWVGYAPREGTLYRRTRGGDEISTLVTAVEGL